MMKKEHKKETLPVSSLKTFQKSFETVEKKEINAMEKLQSRIKELYQKVDRSVDVNVNLQTKITDLMTRLTEIVESFQEIAKFLRGSAPPPKIPTIEEQKEIMSPSIEPIEVAKPVSRPDLTSQLRELVEQNRALTETLRGLETELKRSSTKEAIKKALEKSRLT